MKITMSKKGDKRGRHLVLSCNNEESFGLTRIIIDEVLKGKKVIMETRYIPSPTGVGRRRVDKVLYRFHLDYLERLVYTFPHVEMSPAALRYFQRQSKDIYADLPIPKVRIPGFAGKLWGFQKVGVKWVNDHFAADEDCALNDEMGLGKTVQVLAAIARKNYQNVLVVTTNQGKWAWLKIANLPQYVNGETIPPLFPELDVDVIDGTRAQRNLQLTEEHQITVVNSEMLRTQTSRNRDGDIIASHSYQQLFDKVWDIVIVDETHKFINPAAQQTKGFLRLRSKHSLYMSGTPFLNRPDELWTVLHRIDPVAWPSRDALVAELVIKGENGKPRAYRPEVVARIKKFLNVYTLRRRKDQVVKDLPKTIYKQVLVDLTDEQWVLYNKIREESLLLLDDGRVKTITAYLAIITRLKQAAWSPELYDGTPSSAKIDKLKDIVNELIANGEKAIIFTAWEKSAKIIRREIEAMWEEDGAEHTSAYVTGSITGKDRLSEQDRFNRDEDCKLYIGTIKANQEAITLSAATYVIFTDKEWTPLANAQARDRSASGGLRGAHLAGTGAVVSVVELFARNTIEEWIEELLATKQNLFNRFVENDGGLPVNRVQIESLREMLLR